MSPLARVPRTPAILLIALLLASTPVASAGVVDNELSPVDAGASTGNGVVVTGACLGPLFIDCTVAIVAAFGGCSTMFKQTVCVSAHGGGVGSLSSLSIDGGGAAGAVNEKAVTCTWDGASGVCLGSAVGFSIDDCIPTVTAHGAGYITLAELPDLVFEGDAVLAAPPATAEILGTCKSRGAVEIDLTDAPGVNANGDALAPLKEELHAHLARSLATPLVVVDDGELQQRVLDAFAARMRCAIDGLALDEDGDLVRTDAACG